MYRLVLYFLSALLGAAVLFSAVGLLPFSPQNIVAETLFVLAICLITDRILARATKTKTHTESVLITALIIALIMGPADPLADWIPLTLAATFAIASKFLLARRQSHLFNPAAFGVLGSALIVHYPASWWVGSRPLFPIVLLGGAIILSRIRRFHLAGAFVATYLGLFAVDMLVSGTPIASMFSVLQSMIITSPLVFFAAIMLVEPQTAPQSSKLRIAFGALIALTVFIVQRYFSALPYSFELALLIGNLCAHLIGNNFKQTFILIKKETPAPGISNYWFEPEKPVSFKAGQYLEYTVPHTKPDARGTRRYFTIASSPTEPWILATTRTREPLSTFKRALETLKESGTVHASKVDGDFVLPEDEHRKLAFIAGGIGITPFRIMVKYLIDTKKRRDSILLYGASRQDDFVFKDVFADGAQTFGLKTVFLAPEPDSSAGSSRGRITAETIKTHIPDYGDRLFYISGPEPMIVATMRELAKLGVSTKNIKRDYFDGYPT